MGGVTLRQAGAARRQPLASATSGASLELVPPEAPLAMPKQSLDVTGPLPALPVAAGRRRLLLGATAVLTGAGACVMAALLAPGGLTALDLVTLTLFVVLFGWIAFAFISAAAGFAVVWKAGRLPVDEPQPIIFGKTALLMPTYEEDPGRILAAVQAIHEDLKRIGVAELYDLFVLSDTRDDVVARAEMVGVIRLQARFGAEGRVFYRRRAENTDRKAGNIADWVRRFGGGYGCMVVLDADSLMSAHTIVRLTAEMERDPTLGLLQTSPTLVNAETLFARLQQFASRTYGVMLAAGQDWWSGSEGNYWGHNAIIRTRAFAEQAGLPHLKGRRPFGGHIMSHDFVEAALMRRGGWSVRMAPLLAGSFEEAPPTIVDMARRDRRWCQGNLQHFGVVGAKGLHWVSRLHLARGIMAYVSAPLWLFLLCTGAGVWIEQDEPQLAAAALPAAWLFGLTVALLVAPKIMAGALALRRGEAPEGAVKTFLFFTSIAAEMVVAALVAPVLMLMQSAAVLDVLIGRDSGWGAQQRDPGRLSRKEAWKTHRGHVALGAAGAALACLLDPAMFWWTSPVCAGLLLSAPMSMLLASVDLGWLSRGLGLLSIPEERAPPTVVVRAGELRAAYDQEAATRRKIDRLLRDMPPVYLISPERLRPLATPVHLRMAAE